MARMKNKKARLEKRLDEEYERALDRDYKKYLYNYYRLPNEKKGERLSKDNFAALYAEYFQKAQAGSPTGNVKNIREHKIGEHIFEFETSSFTEKQYKSLTSSIDRARTEIAAGKFAFEGEGDLKDFMQRTKSLDADTLRANFTEYYVMLKGLFGSREEFEAWVSPEISPLDI